MLTLLVTIAPRRGRIQILVPAHLQYEPNLSKMSLRQGKIRRKIHLDLDDNGVQNKEYPTALHILYVIMRRQVLLTWSTAIKLQISGQMDYKKRTFVPKYTRRFSANYNRENSENRPLLP